MKKSIGAVGVAMVLAAFAPTAEARGIIGIGINFGVPVYRPYYGPGFYPYYAPYPVYVAPAPVYYAPPPVIIQSAPTVNQAVQGAPVGSNSSGYEHPYGYIDDRPEKQREAESKYIQQLSAQDDRTRGDAAIELGRMKAQQAIDALCAMLSKDHSPVVRETAARALGLIGSPRSLSALQNAAQADGDRDVRRSAQFSAEVIRANIPR
jgi:hypothetical protein